MAGYEHLSEEVEQRNFSTGIGVLHSLKDGLPSLLPVHRYAVSNTNMRRFIWVGVIAVVLTSVAIAVHVAFVRYRVQPLPSREEMAKAEEDALRRVEAEQARDLPSLQDLPAINRMKIEEALILGPVGKLSPGWPQESEPWYPTNDASKFVPEIDFRLNYSNGNEVAVVEVQQYPNEAWPLYYAKWSPFPRLLPLRPELVLTRVSKFNNQVVMDTQFRFPDDSGKVLFFWPSGKNLVSVTFLSKAIEEELLRRYLEKYPSSLK